MYILSTNTTGQVGVVPRTVKLLTDSNLSTIITAGWLTVSDISPQVLYNTDIIEAIYSFNSGTQSGTHGRFQVSVASTGVITLSQTSDTNTVTAPTDLVSGNLPVASGADTLEDSGIDATDVMTAGEDLVNGNIAETGTGNTILDGGYNIRSNVTASWGGGGTTHQFAATELSSTAIVSATIKASANSVSVTKALAGAGTLDITFSADPGAGTIVQYIATSVAKVS
jgi:hypothetical protein